MKSGGKTTWWPKMSAPFWPIYKSRRKIHSDFTNNKMILVLYLIFLSVSQCQSENLTSRKVIRTNLAFTQESYNVVIPENSIGKVYAVPSDLNTKMGISLSENSGISGENFDKLSIRFRIRSGDTDGFFKAEAEKIGDFVFLLIRTKTNNMDVLNRERRDSYELEIRTRVRDKENRRIKFASEEASTIVRVQVKDVNDLDPFFQPSSYAFMVPEDTPLHQSVGQVHADDADEGINGDNYEFLLNFS